MSPLINTFKIHHIEILSLLDKAQKIGPHSDEGKKLLFKGKNLIISHLGREDKELYPKMNKYEKTKIISDRFSTEMKDLSKIALDLFNRVESGDDGLETAKLLGKVIANLKIRIRNEEKYLYPEYEKLV